MEEITKHLISHFGFQKIHQFREIDRIDLDHFVCILRVHEIHFLFWSELHKAFSIGVRHERPKGTPGRGSELKEWTIVMIPKIIKTLEDAELTVNACRNSW